MLNTFPSFVAEESYQEPKSSNVEDTTHRAVVKYIMLYYANVLPASNIKLMSHIFWKCNKMQRRTKKRKVSSYDLLLEYGNIFYTPRGEKYFYGIVI